MERNAYSQNWQIGLVGKFDMHWKTIYSNSMEKTYCRYRKKPNTNQNLSFDSKTTEADTAKRAEKMLWPEQVKGESRKSVRGKKKEIYVTDFSE